MLQKLRVLQDRPDFQQNPASAIARRMYYRARWAVTEKPWMLKLNGDLEVLVPKGGAGALIYYLGVSEPETAAFVNRFLKPGMVVWDVGAHIGEYSLMAARNVGPSGKVEAFEPQPRIVEYLAKNIAHNGFANIEIHRYAASNACGTAKFQLTCEPSTSHLSHEPTSQECIEVATISLDAFLPLTKRVPDLIKVDVEGAEDLVLDGAANLLSHPKSLWIVEYSSPTRFRALAARFHSYGFQVHRIRPNGSLELVTALTQIGQSGNFVAQRNSGI